MVITKPGKPDYKQVRAHRAISLLDSISKLVERTAAHLIADHLERCNRLHDWQYGCRKRRSAVDAVAVLMNVAEALGRAAEAALGWAGDNGVTFDHAKTEAMFLSKRRRNRYVSGGTESPLTNMPRGGSESGSTLRWPSRSTTPRG